jgi:hypothetical protein
VKKDGLSGTKMALKIAGWPPLYEDGGVERKTEAENSRMAAAEERSAPGKQDGHPSS